MQYATKMYARFVSLPLALLLLIQSFVVSPAYGLSGGPTQPEFQQTSVVGASNLVDPFTGNFNYSIPLMEVGGLPLNLSYTSDHKMEEEASWVGFGWTLNPGAITREVRGLPDDFKGDEVRRHSNMAPSVTTAITPGADVEFFGYGGVGIGQTLAYNNYTGFSVSENYSPHINVAKIIADDNDAGSEQAQTEGTKSSFSESVLKLYETYRWNSSLSANINSRSGLTNIHMGLSYGNFFTPSGDVNFGGLTYTPIGELPRNMSALTGTFKFGPKPGAPISLHGSYQQQVTRQWLARKRQSQKGYGYLYLQDTPDYRGIMDYNEERGGIPSSNAPRLPMPFGTPDNFMVSGPGLAGNIRIKRNDVGVFRPSASVSYNDALGIGLDLTGGNIVHPGVNYQASVIKSTEGGWKDSQPSVLVNRRFLRSVGLNESAYMHFTGEITNGVSKDRFADWGGVDPIKSQVGFALINPRELTSGAQFFAGRHTERTRKDVTPSVSTERKRRARSVTYLTNAEARRGALERRLVFYSAISGKQDFSNFDGRRTSLSRVAGYRKAHHISEIDVVSEGGQRFVYGLPLYNTVKQEVTFNASGLRNINTDSPGKDSYGLIEYTPNHHNTVANRQGKDHFFDRVDTDAYVTSNLLTAVLSPDYVDLTRNGPSQDDLGQYLHISYSTEVRDHPRLDKKQPYGFGWRIPTTPLRNMARFSEGNLSDPNDDRAFYTYGQKEIAYVHHMDSKTHRAVFYTSPRSDALPVDVNSNVLKNGPRLRKLDKIELYTLAELKKQDEDAVPLKTVHFEYAQSGDEAISGRLPNAENEDIGKLTLKKVYFTYADNQRGKEQPYEFDYLTKSGSAKVTYQPNMVDRWGNQRPSQSSYEGPLRFPYSIQNEPQPIGIGNLGRITLPTGAEIEVSYQADDYAYVHNKRAGRMYRLLGVSDKRPGADGFKMTQLLYKDGLNPHRWLHVAIDNLPQDLPPAEVKKYVLDNYLTDVEQIYFEARIQWDEGSDPNRDSEKVTGFIDTKYFRDGGNVIVDTDTDDGTVHLSLPLRPVNNSGRSNRLGSRIHPFTYAALKKLRDEIPRRIFEIDSDQRAGEQIKQAALMPLLTTGVLQFRGFYSNQLTQRKARKIHSDNSYIRLADLSFAKVGDGTRVYSVKLDDQWAPQGDVGRANTYTQIYSYETESEDGRTISSGVAANEPMVGKEENLLVNVASSIERRLLAPNEILRMQGPIGFQFYPGAKVGYSKVSMRTEIEEKYKQSKPGVTTYEYYTTRDFPVIATRTDLNHKKLPWRPQIGFSVRRAVDAYAGSQGYSIQVNDMCGKMKSQTEYNHYGTPISSSLYKYRQRTATTGERRLDNLVPVADPDSDDTLEDDLIGLEEDIWIASRSNETVTQGSGINLNGDMGAETVIPMMFLSMFRSLTQAVTSFQTVVTTKLISRHGILDEVIVTKDGSNLSSKNHRWDRLTGQVLLSSTENEFEQPVYSATMPAYYVDAQASMGAAYQNAGARFENVTIGDNGRVIRGLASPEKVFHGGEDLLISEEYYPFGRHRYNYPFRWSYRATAIKQGNSINLVREDGTPVKYIGGYQERDREITIHILRSGYKNMLTSPAAQTTSLVRPNGAQEISWQAAATEKVVLSSSAVEYSDVWGDRCLLSKIVPPVPPVEDTTTVDPPTPPDPECADATCVYPNCDCNDQPICSDPNCVYPDCNCGDGGLCEALKERLLNTPFISPDPSRSCADYTIQGIPWEEDVDQLEACDLCMDLYVFYRARGLLNNVSDYEVDCGDVGRFIWIDDNAEAKVRACDFIKKSDTSINPHLRYRGDYNLRTILNNGTDRGSCAWACDLNAPPSPRSVQRPVAKSINSTCFPWNGKPEIGNPYRNGRRGNWRVTANYVSGQEYRHLSKMKASVNPPVAAGNRTDQPLLHADGGMINYEPFWYHAGGSYNKLNGGASHQLVTNINRYDDYGHPKETQDALGIPSATQYGFFQSLPVATTQNAELKDMAFDGFETYNYRVPDVSDAYAPHIDWGLRGRGGDDRRVTEDVAHTGRSSVRLVPIKGDISLTGTFPVRTCPDEASDCPEESCSCLHTFAPAASQKYQLSVWVTKDESLTCGEPVNTDQALSDGIRLVVNYVTDGARAQRVVAAPSGPIIEGWQRIVTDFTIPENAKQIEVRISAGQGTADKQRQYYVDDFRMYPFEANMVSYVYNNETLQLMAQLDENGYAVFYEYDDERRLIRQKRETERGVMTITEQHANISPRGAR